MQGHAVIELRQREALPVLQTLKTWMEKEYPAIVVKKAPSPRLCHTAYLAGRSFASIPKMHV